MFVLLLSFDTVWIRFLALLACLLVYFLFGFLCGGIVFMGAVAAGLGRAVLD
jgi:hypothetical protein